MLVYVCRTTKNMSYANFVNSSDARCAGRKRSSSSHSQLLKSLALQVRAAGFACLTNPGIILCNNHILS